MFSITSPFNINPTDFQKEGVMPHLVCTTSGRCIECEKESAMCSRNDDPTQIDLPTTWCAICGVSPQHHDIPGGRDHKWVDANPDTDGHEDDSRYEESYEAHQLAVSSWVRRNLDYAQYPQARGSQYEG